MNPVNAVVLISSGLDSLLAARIIHDLGISVTGLHCVFRFDPTVREDNRIEIDRLFGPIGIPIEILDITDSFFKVMLHPAHGYGSGVNPCIDCKILMFNEARRMMERTGAGFLVTGEVLGQRPMTQKRTMMTHIEKSAGLAGRVLRPLSSLHLDETLAEQKGWVDRSKLYSIAGRGRRQQIALAEQFGITEYNQPAGGCILTNPQFSQRVRALFAHRGKETLSVSDLQLCRLGRHFWSSGRLQVIVGRNEQENVLLEKYRSDRTALEPVSLNGPLTLTDRDAAPPDLVTAASIAARYCRHEDRCVEFICDLRDGKKRIEAAAATAEQCDSWQV